MVVTGDRDAYQLVGDGVRIMTTSRGITDTKVYDREGVIDRYGIPPELIPDFIGLKGDTSDNIPGVPGIGDKTASELLQRFGDLETVLTSVDQISGAKRKENLTEPRRGRARSPSSSPRSSTTSPSTSTSRPRSPAAPTAPTSARPSASGSCATRCAASRRRSYELEATRSRAPRQQDAKTIPVRQGRPADIDMLGGDPLALVALAPEVAEGELIPREEHWRFGAYAGGSHALVGECDDPAELVAAAKDRPVVAHDAKALGDVPPNLVFDTEIAAYLLDPARRGYPLDELCRGARPRRQRRRRAGRPRRARPHARRAAGRAAARARARRPPDRHRAAARARPARVREAGHQARHRAARDRRQPHPRRRQPARARDLGGRRRGVRDRLPAAARPHPVREARPVAQAPRQDRLLHRRARPAGDPRRAPDHPQDRALPGALQARPDLPRRAPRLDRRRRPPAHDLPAGHRRHRPAREHQPEPPEHPDPHRDRPRDPRLLHRRARQRA